MMYEVHSAIQTPPPIESKRLLLHCLASDVHQGSKVRITLVVIISSVYGQRRKRDQSKSQQTTLSNNLFNFQHFDLKGVEASFVDHPAGGFLITRLSHSLEHTARVAQHSYPRNNPSKSRHFLPFISLGVAGSVFQLVFIAAVVPRALSMIERQGVGEKVRTRLESNERGGTFPNSDGT